MSDADETQHKQGRWVPITKALSRYLPQDRPYTPLEAMFSITCDYDAGNTATISGYAALWQWSRGKVVRFLADVGVVLQYPGDTTRTQNQRGQITIQMTVRKRADSEQIMVIDSRWLYGVASRKRTESGQKTSRSRVTTNNPEPELTNIPDWLPLEPWLSFVEMRKQIKKPMTVRAMQLAIQKLDALRKAGHDVVAIIDSSVLNGWQDLYPPRQGSVLPAASVVSHAASTTLDPERAKAIRRTLAELDGGKC